MTIIYYNGEYERHNTNKNTKGNNMDWALIIAILAIIMDG